MTLPAIRRTDEAPEHLYFGEVGNAILVHGFGHEDDGVAIQAAGVMSPVAPAGVGGECLFRNVYVAVEGLTAGTLTFQARVDGRNHEVFQTTVDGLNPERQRFEIPLTHGYPTGGTELSRAGIRGTWFQLVWTAVDTGGTDYDIDVEGAWLEFEVVREAVEHRGFMAAPALPATRPLTDVLFLGELGDGVWTLDLSGTGGCAEISADGQLCRTHRGLLGEFDFTTDPFDYGKVKGAGTNDWEHLLGPDPDRVSLNVAGGYLEFTNNIGLIWLAVPPAARMMLELEVFTEGATELQPTALLGCQQDTGDDFAMWANRYIVTPTNDRHALGKRVAGVDSYEIPVVAGQTNAWFWQSFFYFPASPNQKLYGSDNDTNWIQQSFDGAHFARSGRPGIRVFAQHAAPNASCRVRRGRAYDDAQITVQNVPTAHEVRFIRAAGLHAGSTVTVQNTSGSTQSVVMDATTFPVPGDIKRLGPQTRIEVWEIAGAKQGEMTPVNGVAWGDIYCFRCGSVSLGYVLEPNDVAPAGANGECLFKNVYLPVVRNNEVDLDCTFTPILDDVELTSEQQTIVFPALASARPVTEVCEIALNRPYELVAVEEARYGMRGTWFRFRIDDANFPGDGTVLGFAGAELEFEVVRESIGGVTLEPAPPPAPTEGAMLVESGDVLLLESGDQLLKG